MKSFEHELARASAEWVRDGLMDPVQREAILARHPPPPAGTSPWFSRFVAILGMIGGVLIAAGLILIISSNWEHISDWTKIGVLLVLLGAFNGLGWRLKVAPGHYPKTGDACLMVGGMLFLAGIALVSQIFHLNARPATGVLVWALGLAAVPWMTRSKGAMFLSLIAWLTWLGYEFATVGGPLELTLDHYNSFEVFAWWALYALLGMALVLGGLALRHGGFREFSGTFTTPGLLVVCACLYALGFYRHGYDWYSRSAETALICNPLSVGIAGALLALAGVCAFGRARAETAALGPWLLAGLVPVAGILLHADLGDGGWLWSVLSWALLFVLNIGMIRIGLREGRESWVNFAIGAIALNIITRYFDLFGTMLQGGLFFMVTGAVILALGVFLEKQRRALLARLHHPQPA